MRFINESSVFINLSNTMRRQSRLTNWFGNQADDNRPTVNADDVDTDAETAPTSKNTTNNESPKAKPKVVKHFNHEWLTKYSWLKFYEGTMFCDSCKLENKENALTCGSKIFRHSTLVRHMKSDDHRAAVQAFSLHQQMTCVVSRILNEKDAAVHSAMLNVYWLAQEQIASSKSSSFIIMELCVRHGLEFPKTFSEKGLMYTSHCAVDDMQDAIAASFKSTVNSQIRSSPFISILVDESTDISVTKKLLIYVRSLTSSFDVETHFLANIQIPDGKAGTILNSVSETFEHRDIPMSKSVAVGSDGAAVMTGHKNGFVAMLNRQVQTPIIGVHCIAHRLALVTSQLQAAEKIPYMRRFQNTLSDIFYFFKKSSVRRERLTEIERVLESDQVTFKEIHSVRWFSIYSALEAVFRTWKSLAMFLENERVYSNNSTAKGILQRISSYKFLLVLHLLMDVIPIMTRLSLRFQRDNIDLASLRPSIDGVIQQLQYLKGNDGPALEMFLKKCPKGQQAYAEVPITREGGVDVQFANVRKAFLDNLMTQLEHRFPAVATDVVTCLSVLSLQGLSFMDEDGRQKWGEDQLARIVDFYYGSLHGQDKSDNESALPFIDKDAVLLEWNLCKNLVHQQHYPCSSIQGIWQILSSRHPDLFPNLLKLVQVTVLLPMQTATVERGFSVQNIIKTAHRNRLTASRLDSFMHLSLGPPVRDVDLDEAVKLWKKQKKRKLFR